MMGCGLKINHPDIREIDFSSTVVIFTGADGILVNKNEITLKAVVGSTVSDFRKRLLSK